MACLIAAPCSGSGKTLLSLCLSALAHERGVALQPFKVGPDYLDPQLLSAVAGRPCRNLDTLLCGPDWVRRCFLWHGSRAEQVLVEGVMGLFDGRGPSSDGSSAEVAALLGLPVVLVVEASRQAGSLAALVRGFRDHGPPAVRLAGVVLNRVGSERHHALLREALEAIAVPLLGVLPQHACLELPSRHLGLLPPEELVDLGERRRQWAQLAQRHLDLGRLEPLLAPPTAGAAGALDPILWSLAQAIPERAGEGLESSEPREREHVGRRGVGAHRGGEETLGGGGAAGGSPGGGALSRGALGGPLSGGALGGAVNGALSEGGGGGEGDGALSEGGGGGGALGGYQPSWDQLEAAGASGSPPPLTVAIACDRAFHFRYPEAEELLRAVGLEAQAWSPLADEPLPPGCRAVILPGGYPELHAAQLAASRRSLGALTAAAAAGLPILAECGGLLLLGQQLHDANDQPQAMAGLLPFSARRGGLSLGYRRAEAISDGLLVRRGEVLVGHEFHRWQLLEANGTAQVEATDAAGEEHPADRAGAAGRADAAGVAANQRNEPMTATRRLWQLEGWGSPRRPEGWTTTHIHATWLHLHWAGCPVIPWRLAAASASAAPLPKSAASSIPRTPARPR